MNQKIKILAEIYRKEFVDGEYEIIEYKKYKLSYRRTICINFFEILSDHSLEKFKYNKNGFHYYNMSPFIIKRY